jgi:16S rRNA G966 N2-methylase RsmD
MLSVEQCSSEITAKFKASLVQGETLIDLTGGMGVDVAYMSKNFKKAFYFEQNTDLLNVTKYNFEHLGIQNVEFMEGNSVDYIKNNAGWFKPTVELPASVELSWIYLDPHRRDDTGSKVVRLQDCEPNILAIKDLLFEYTNSILLKASPMLDIDLAILDLGNVSQVYVVAVENEVKEVLFHIKNPRSDDSQTTQTETSNYRLTTTNGVILNAINLSKTHSTTLSFTKSDEKNASIKIGSPQQYLYEPNAAIMKAGGFRYIAQHFDLQKIASHSHLYTSEELVEHFQGRIFKIIAVCRLDKKEISKYLMDKKANITIRNFPLTVQQIRDKLKLSDGGSEYLFATTDAQNQKIVIICRKIG